MLARHAPRQRLSSTRSSRYCTAHDGKAPFARLFKAAIEAQLCSGGVPGPARAGSDRFYNRARALSCAATISLAKNLKSIEHGHSAGFIGSDEVSRTANLNHDPSSHHFLVVRPLPLLWQKGEGRFEVNRDKTVYVNHYYQS
jgi:hypothetical protein